MEKINKNAPHQAVILVRCEIYERLQNGQCSGRPVEKLSDLFTFIGQDVDDVRCQVEQFMEKIKNAKQQTS